MKKLQMFLMAIFAFCMQNVNAQDEAMSISCSSPDLGVKVKRCVAAGKNVLIDFVLTNRGDKDIERYHVSEVSAFDDEGTGYKGEYGGQLSMKFPDKDNYIKAGSIDFVYAVFDMPVDVPRKLTLRIEDANRAATSIVKVKLNIGPYAGAAETFIIDIKNIPITRD